MDNNTAKLIDKDLTAAVNEVLAQHGFTGRIAGLRYDDTGFTFTGKATTLDTDAIDTKKRAELEAYGSLYGVTADCYGTEFTWSGVTYKFTGLVEGRATKNVFTATSLRDGKSYRFPRDFATIIMAAAAAAKAA